MARGDKSKDSDKQKPTAEQIAVSSEESGVPAIEAKSRGGTKVNKASGGGKESGSGRERADTRMSSPKVGKKGGTSSASDSAAKRSAAAKKAAATRKRNRSAHETEATAPQLFEDGGQQDNGKADLIEPARDDGEIHYRNGLLGTFARAGYATIYGMSYGAAFPVCLLARIFARSPDP